MTARVNLFTGNVPNILQTALDPLIVKLTEHDQAMDGVGIPLGTSTSSAIETKTSGALTVGVRKSYVSVTNTVAFTLADGAYIGQEKVIECSAVSGTPLGTLTVATPFTNEGATHTFTAVGQKIRYEWTASGWKMVEKVRAGRQAVTVGTTVLRDATANSGLDLAAAYDLSVTGTVHSTGTKGIPNGTVPGERIHVDVLTAASVATGDIDITAWTTVGVAATNWGSTGTSIGSAGTVTTGVLDGIWDGSKWQMIVTATATLA